MDFDLFARVGRRGGGGAIEVTKPNKFIGLPWIFPQFHIIPHFWARKGSPLYLAEKVTNPYGFVLGRPSISRGPQNPE